MPAGLAGTLLSGSLLQATAWQPFAHYTVAAEDKFQKPSISQGKPLRLMQEPVST